MAPIVCNPSAASLSAVLGPTPHNSSAASGARRMPERKYVSMREGEVEFRRMLHFATSAKFSFEQRHEGRYRYYRYDGTKVGQGPNSTYSEDSQHGLANGEDSKVQLRSQSGQG